MRAKLSLLLIPPAIGALLELDGLSRRFDCSWDEQGEAWLAEGDVDAARGAFHRSLTAFSLYQLGHIAKERNEWFGALKYLDAAALTAQDTTLKERITSTRLTIVQELNVSAMTAEDALVQAVSRRPGKIQSTYASVALPDPGSLSNLLLASAPKTGSTALVSRLIQTYPDMAGATCKETKFLLTSDDLERYRTLFPLDEQYSVRIDGGLYGQAATAPSVARFVALKMPDVRVVGLLRDPVHRFISAWVGQLVQGLTNATCPAFFAQNLEVRNDGRYVTSVTAWNTLGPDRVLFLPTTALDDPNLYDLVATFAGSSGERPVRTDERWNAGTNHVVSYDRGSRFFELATGSTRWRCDSVALERFYAPSDVALLPELLVSTTSDSLRFWCQDDWFCRFAPALCCDDPPLNWSLRTCSFDGVVESGRVRVPLNLTAVSSLSEVITILRPQFTDVCHHLPGTSDECVATLLADVVRAITSRCRTL